MEASFTMIRCFICSGSLIDHNYCDTSESYKPAGKEKIVQRGSPSTFTLLGLVATGLLRLQVFLTLTNEQWTYNSAWLEVAGTADMSSQ